MKKYVTIVLYMIILASIIIVFSTLNTSDSYEDKSIKINEINSSETIKDYEMSKLKSKKIENILLNIVANQKEDTKLKEVNGISNSMANKLNLKLINLGKDIENYLEDTKYEDENRVKKSRMELLREYSEVHYFLDSDNGKLSQTFIFWLPDGIISQIELTWLGGKCIDEKIFSGI